MCSIFMRLQWAENFSFMLNAFWRLHALHFLRLFSNHSTIDVIFAGLSDWHASQMQSILREWYSGLYDRVYEDDDAASNCSRHILISRGHFQPHAKLQSSSYDIVKSALFMWLQNYVTHAAEKQGNPGWFGDPLCTFMMCTDSCTSCNFYLVAFD